MKWKNPSSFARHLISLPTALDALHPRPARFTPVCLSCKHADILGVCPGWNKHRIDTLHAATMPKQKLSQGKHHNYCLLLCLRGWLSVVACSPSLTSVGEASDLQRKHFARQSAGFGSGFIHWSLRCYATFTLDTRYQPGSTCKFPAAILRNLLESRKELHTQVYCNSKQNIYIYIYI